MINLFFKIFAVFFSFFYLLYAIVLFQQSRVLVRTIRTEIDKWVILISGFQILLGFLLIFYSLIL